MADGAARQAAWLLAGNEAPEWTLAAARRYEADSEPAVRDRYAAVRDA